MHQSAITRRQPARCLLAAAARVRSAS